MLKEDSNKDRVRRVLPWETVELISIVMKFDQCKKMNMKELVEEAKFWKCRGELKALKKNRRHFTNAIIKAWLKFSFDRYMLSAKEGHIVSANPGEHVAYTREMRIRNLKVERFR